MDAAAAEVEEVGGGSQQRGAMAVNDFFWRGMYSTYGRSTQQEGVLQKIGMVEYIIYC